ncbi:hypothetical protein [Micromonospora inyonensis]|uniref:Uncharacterized protein n=1 Tax=Micromonospora inyonensis TaxID=47866 RepID=A0A1C6RDL6_9ACTN|nr:hypothetical protein [Micromonospora inyonensis]SCL15054.1 hypothetical protein GA0074694_1032 [Micromonospora inyonensis]
MVSPNKGQLALGPGILREAPLGSLEPSDLSTPWDPAWNTMGYTKDGSKISYELDTGAVEVAEEIDPIHIAINSRKLKVAFALMQLTATNLRTAWNGGTITAGTGIVIYEPPEPGEEVRRMLGFESSDGTERWVFRECLQGGNVELERKRGSDAANIGNEFMLAKPAPTIRPFAVILAAPARA